MTRAVAIDLGARRIGVAVSGGTGTMAFPREIIRRTGDRSADHRKVAAVVEDVGADVVVVGWPLSLDGTEGPAARGAADEARQLEDALAARGVRVELFDERFTTVTADAGLAAAGKRGPARRHSVDSAAATVLLESWLASR